MGVIPASGANINLQATGNITINDITGATPGVTTDGVATLNLGNGGSFSLTSQSGSVNFVDPTNTIATTGGAINISGASLLLGNLNTTTGVNGGNVNLSATGGIAAGDIIVSSGGGYSASGGDVNLSAGGDITTGSINSSSNDATTTGRGGNVVATTTGGSITTGTINSSVVKGGGGDFTGAAGAVTLTATDNITVNDAINASAIAIRVDGDASVTGGNVTLQTTNTAGSNIRFTTINTQTIADDFGDGNTVQGGNVQVLTNGLIQGIGTGEAIATGGFFTSQEGTIVRNGLWKVLSEFNTRRRNNVDFIVGDASVNGTGGTINAGEGNAGESLIITGGNFPVSPNGGDASGTPTGITITSVNTPPTLTANSSLPNTQINQPVTLTFSSLAALVLDANNDITSIQVDAVNTGNLTINGLPILPGVTTLSSDDTLVYTPPADTNGSLNAFVISANDGVSSSAPVQVGINVSQIPPTQIPPTQIPTPIPTPTFTPTPSPCTFQCNPPGKPIDPGSNNPQIDNPVLNTDPTPEGNFTDDFADHSGIPTPRIKALDDAKEIARQNTEGNRAKPAFIYTSFVPVEILPREKS